MRKSHGADSLACRGRSQPLGSNTGLGPHQPTSEIDLHTHTWWPGGVKYLTLSKRDKIAEMGVATHPDATNGAFPPRYQLMAPFVPPTTNPSEPHPPGPAL